MASVDCLGQLFGSVCIRYTCYSIASLIHNTLAEALLLNFDSDITAHILTECKQMQQVLYQVEENS